MFHMEMSKEEFYKPDSITNNEMTRQLPHPEKLLNIFPLHVFYCELILMSKYNTCTIVLPTR